MSKIRTGFVILIASTCWAVDATTDLESSVAFQAHTDNVQAYDILQILLDGLYGAPSLLLADQNGKILLGKLNETEPAARTLIRDFKLNHGAPGGIASIVPPGAIGGVMLQSGDVSRLETTWRTPMWQSRGLADEPIGLAFVQDPNGAAVNLPILWSEQGIRFERSHSRAILERSPFLESSPLEVLPERQMRFCLANRIAVNAVNLSPSEIETVRAEGHGEIHVSWPKPGPWLYNARLTEAKYVCRWENNAAIVDKAAFYAKDEEAPVATLSNHDETPKEADGAVIRTLELRIEEGCLHETKERGGQLLARPRVIRYSYREQQRDTGASEILESVRVSDETGKELASLTFSPPRASTIPPAVLMDMDAVLSLTPTDDLRVRYYAMLKNYFNLRRDRTSKNPERYRVLEKECRALITDADAARDDEVALAARARITGFAIVQEDWDAWERASRDFFLHSKGQLDQPQQSMELGWALGYAQEHKRESYYLDLMALQRATPHATPPSTTGSQTRRNPLRK